MEFPSAADVVGQTDDAMVIGGGARPIGMGRAFAAVAEDADAPFINAAGTADIKGPQAMSMFTNLLGDVYYSEFCGAIPAPFGAVGLGYIATGVNQIDTSPLPSDYYDALFLINYSTPLSRFLDYGKNVFVGLNYKIFSRGFSGGYNDHASGMSMDFGMKFVLTPNLSFGFVRQNFLPVSLGGVLRWPSGAEESLSGLNKLAIGIKPTNFHGKLLLAFDADLPYSSGRPTTLHFGCEWMLAPYFTLRGGADQSIDARNPSKTSFNPAAGLSIGASGFRLDYAYHPYYNDPGLATTYVSVSYQGKPWFALKGEID